MNYTLKSIFGFLILLTVNTAYGQLYKNNIRQYKVHLSTEGEDLIETGNLISADSMSTTFKDKGYGPVAVNLGSMRKKELSPSKIYDLVSEATVIVSSVGRCGELNARGEECKRIHTYPASGYIIDAEGIVVTNYHVANGYVTKYNKDSREGFLVMMKDGTTYPVTEILSADKSNDLAILKIDTRGAKLPALHVATKDAEIGDPVYIVSHPKGYFYAFSSGMVTDKFSDINALQYRNVMAISADFAAGSSGAAIIDQYANVIGTVTYTKTLQHSDDATKTQMVLKATIPVSSLLKLIKEGN
ncbi:S1 family peptidase [Robertkochia solimangrovi]|uniref:S1 family peptidase n=1 Tax=Robertkochia solimangrovi TaxID=2213046 RepID=UPI0013A592BC|nr:serine protease [Robertkochia solimangrovi]